MAEKKTCFIITPIGEEGSETRKHIDGVIKGAVDPALENKYDIIPPHEINQIGSVTDDVLNYILTSDLVVANLTGLNPNVMYELGYRHCVGKPVIAIAEKGTKPPFDIQNDRTFYYEYSVEGIAKLREQLVEVEGNIEFDKPQKSEMIPDKTHSVAAKSAGYSSNTKATYRVYIEPKAYTASSSWNKFEEIIIPYFYKRYFADVSFFRNDEYGILFVISSPKYHPIKEIKNEIECVAKAAYLQIFSISIS